MKKSRTSPSFGGLRHRAINTINQILKTVILIAAVSLFVYYGLTLSGRATVVTSSDPYNSKSAYQNVVSSFANSIKGRSKLTFDGDSLTKRLIEKFPEISDVNVEVPLFGRQPIVRIQVSPPSAILTTKTKSYLLDSQGKIVPGNASAHKGSLIEITDTDQSSIQLGSQIFSSDQLDFLKVVNTQLARSNVDILYYKLPNRSEEVDVYIKGRAYYAKLDLNGDPNKQSGELLASLHYFSKKHIHPSKYVDVRISGRIFYK